MSFIFFLTIAASSVAQVAAPDPSSVEAKQKIGEAIGQILQAQGAAARSTLEALPDEKLSAKDQIFRRCTLSRLTLAGPSGAQAAKPQRIDPFADKLLTLYRIYWRASSLSDSNRPAAEQIFLQGIAKLVGRSSLKDMDEAEALIQARLKARGLFSQLGQTGALHDLMIWRRDTQKIEETQLPEGSYPTRVHYLDRFLSLGWSSYLSCERTGTGGWTTKEGLYVIVPSYDSLVDENFRINFLAHESQHYSDIKRFGELPGWRLEFRAKLVELAYAQATRNEVLGNFANNQGDDPNDQHSFANKKIIDALATRLALAKGAKLESAAISDLQRAAADELKADTLRLKTEMPSEKYPNARRR